MPKNLIGTGVDQVPVNGMLGDLAFQNKESLSITGGSAALSELELNAVYKEISSTAVDVFVYDTSKDSDGGTWRGRCQHTSWYNETLNTSTRGSRREFPAVAVIVATSTTVTIYDGDDPTLPMWMVFLQGSYYYLPPGRTMSCLSALNGIVMMGFNQSVAGICYIDFVSENSKVYSSSSSEYRDWTKPISQRNTGGGWVTNSAYAIINDQVNDVAMTVLPNAPIDSATGLPIPTIAVATNGGISVIKHDNTITSQTAGASGSSGYDWGIFTAVQFSSDGSLWATQSHRSSTFGANVKYIPQPYTSFTNAYGWGGYVSYPAVLGYAFGGGAERIRYITSEENNTLTVGTDYPALGISKIANNNLTFATSMVANITYGYNTGWMPGNIKGAWLSDKTQETIVSNDLITNGDGSSATGWTADGGNTLISTGGNLKCTTNIADGAYFGQGVSVVVGKTYTFTATIISDGTSKSAKMFLGTANGFGNISSGPEGYTFGSTSITWTATSTTTVWLWFYGSVTTSGTYILIDNVSGRLADPDRSVNNKGLQVFGSVTKTPVAPGAELVAYSGWSGSNYLEQPYNSSMDFGTGDFCFAGWVKATVGGNIIARDNISSVDGIRLTLLNSSTVRVTVTSVVDRDISYSGALNDTWTFIVVKRFNSVISTYVNSVRIDSFSNTTNLSGTDKKISLGVSAASSTMMALWRVSTTAPSDDQIRKMYNDEKFLFQENAKAVLYGTSNAVTALAYDEDTSLLHVGTSSGRSVFDGLRRVDNTTVAVSAAISAANGLVAEN